MTNNKLPRVGDKVKIVNCKAAVKNKDRIFTVKASPYVVVCSR